MLNQKCGPNSWFFIISFDFVNKFFKSFMQLQNQVKETPHFTSIDPPVTSTSIVSASPSPSPSISPRNVVPPQSRRLIDSTPGSSDDEEQVDSVSFILCFQLNNHLICLQTG